MAYDLDLADRVRELLTGVRGVEERPMFGGLAFLIDGNLCVAVSGQGGLLVRVSHQDTDVLSRRKHVRPMVMRGREVRGWLRVDADGVRTGRQLKGWVSRGAGYARSLPAK